MKTALLDDCDLRTLSYVKSHVIFYLLDALTEHDPAASDLLGGRRFSLAFKVRNGSYCRLSSDGRKMHYSGEKSGVPSLTLFFPSERHLVHLLNGKKATLIPLPGGPGFLTVIPIFKALTARLQEFMQARGEKQDALKPMITRLALNAAIMGVSQVAAHDRYTAVRSRNIPDGIIAIEVDDTPDLNCFLRIENNRFSPFRGVPSEAVRARLHFESLDAAFRMLTGKQRAMTALGSGSIKIRGRLPMIQGLFPLLDRFSAYMAAEA